MPVVAHEGNNRKAGRVAMNKKSTPEHRSGSLRFVPSVRLGLLLALCGVAARADEGDLKTAMPVLLKVLTYDVNFDARGVGDFVILVVGDNAAKRGALIKDLENVSVTKVKNRAVKYVPIELKDEGALQAEIDRSKASAVLAVPGTSPAGVKTISEVSQDNQIYALALEAAMVEQALPVGVTVTGGKTQIVINEKAARSVGARFETSVLKLARVIQ
jgi:hypothetical protein